MKQCRHIVKKTRNIIDAPMRQKITPTAGEILADGSTIELVWADAERTSLNLLVYKSNETILTPSYEHADKIYVPANVDSTILRAIRFPSGVRSFGSVRELFDETAHRLARQHDLQEESIALATYFNFTTWLPELLPTAPLLSIVAPPPASSETLMQDLAIFCRRPLLFSDPSAADLLGLPFYLQPTLLLDVSHAGAELQRRLRASLRRGIFFVKMGRAVNLFGPKVVCSQLPLTDRSLFGAALEIAINLSRPLSILDQGTSEKQAEGFQGKFLAYRLEALRSARAPQIDCADLTTPMATLARALAAGIVGDDDLQRRVVPLLRGQDREFQVDLASSIECIVVEALLVFSYDTDRQTIMVIEITQVVNTILAGRGEIRELSPEDTGWKLKSLGIQTEPIGRKGKGLRLTNSIRKRIHELARIYGVRSIQGGTVAKCRQCNEPHAQQGEGR